jgi:hypothetical protein
MHLTKQGWNTKMTKDNEQHTNAERRLTEELAKQAHEEPGSEGEAQAKERRAQVEKELTQPKQR